MLKLMIKMPEMIILYLKYTIATNQFSSVQFSLNWVGIIIGKYHTTTTLVVNPSRAV